MDTPSVIDVSRWTGLEAGLLREAFRFPQRQFADFLGASWRTVANWDDKREDIVPRPVWQDALDTALAEAKPDVQQRFATLVAQHSSRTVGRRGPEVGSLEAPERESTDVEHAIAARELAPVSETDISVIRNMLASLTATDHQFGGGFARRAAGSFLLEVVQPRLSAPGPQRVRGPMHAVAAEFQMRVAWMHLDVADARAARSAAREAFSSAQRSEDLATGAWVMSMSALLETWLGNPVAAVAYAHAGVGFATSGPHLVKAFAHGKLARALASKGEGSDAKRALAQARRLFESAPADEAERVPTTIHDGYSDAYLLDEEAHCYRDLGNDSQALALSEQCLGLRGPDRFTRNRAFATGNAALSFARLGKVEEACAGAHDLLKLVALLDSRRVAARLDAVLQQLEPHSSTRPVKELNEHVRAAGIRTAHA